MRRFLGFGLVAVLLSGCMMDVKLPPLTSPTATASPTWVPKIQVRQVSVAEVPGAEWFDLSYPRFSAIDATDAENEIAAQLNGKVEVLVAQFKAAFATEPSDEAYLLVDVVETRVYPQFVFFNLNADFYLPPDNHHTYEDWSAAFNPTTGAEITLLSQLAPGKRAAFADFVGQQLRMQSVDPDLLTYDEVKGEDAIFRNWIPRSVGLTIEFNENEIGSLAAGRPSVLLFWDELLTYLKPDSPLAELYG